MNNNNEQYDYAAAMDKLLNPKKITKNASDNAINEALHSLNKAAEILDAMGHFGAAEVVTRMMEHIPTVLHKVESTQASTEFVKNASVEMQTQKQLEAEMLEALLGPRNASAGEEDQSQEQLQAEMLGALLGNERCF